MQYQTRQFTCGPASVHNILNFYQGRTSPTITQCEDACRVNGDLNTNGTDHNQLKKAIRGFGYHCAGHSFKTWRGFEWWLFDRMIPHPFILHDRSKGHWITVIGRIADTAEWIIIDSANEDLILRWNLETFREAVYKHGCRIYAITVW